ncbi:MAG TPA: hypothetical protein VJ183_15935 [Chloroflexia bacterium]|nr:hypothetical protein [Chloroflexia bacterium]
MNIPWAGSSYAPPGLGNKWATLTPGLRLEATFYRPYGALLSHDVKGRVLQKHLLPQFGANPLLLPHFELQFVPLIIHD